MAAARRLRVSSGAILLLSLLLLPSSSLLGSLAADEPSSPASPTWSDAGKSEGAVPAGVEKEEETHRFNLCKLTGHFRIRFFGVVIECPKPNGFKPFGPGGGHQPPVSSASVDVHREKGTAASDGEKSKASTGAGRAKEENKDEL